MARCRDSCVDASEVQISHQPFQSMSTTFLLENIETKSAHESDAPLKYACQHGSEAWTALIQNCT